MTKLTQKQRRQIKRDKITGTFSCSICLTDEKKRMITLACEHKFHYECINEWFSEGIKKCGDEDGAVGVLSPLENGTIHLNYDGRLLFHCPECRCEYAMKISESHGTYSRVISFQKVLAKINYNNQGYGKIQHYLIDIMDLLLYITRRKVLRHHEEQIVKKNAKHLNDLLEGIFSGNTELFIYECVECKAREPLYCLHPFCGSGFKLINKPMADSLQGETNLKLMDYEDLSKYL
jgi:hypothetical protein